jgi:hypothetical protein
MTGIQDVIYCLGCRQPMSPSEAACPACGVDQNEARARRMQTAAPPSRAAKAQPAAVEPRTEAVPCPNCKVTVPPEESRCHYCGHLMDDPDAQARFDVGYSKIYAGIGIFFALVALIPLWALPFQSVLGGFAAVAMGRLAQAEDRYSPLGGIVVTIGFVAAILGYVLRLIMVV